MAVAIGGRQLLPLDLMTLVDDHDVRLTHEAGNDLCYFASAFITISLYVMCVLYNNLLSFVFDRSVA